MCRGATKLSARHPVNASSNRPSPVRIATSLTLCSCRNQLLMVQCLLRVYAIPLIVIYLYTSRVPVEGKSSVCVCVICMKYRIIVLIIISSAWVKYYYRICKHIIHTCTPTHARMRTHTHTHVAVQIVAVRWVAGTQP